MVSEVLASDTLCRTSYNQAMQAGVICSPVLESPRWVDSRYRDVTPTRVPAASDGGTLLVPNSCTREVKKRLDFEMFYS